MAVGLTVPSSLGDVVLVQVGSSDRRRYLASPGDKWLWKLVLKVQFFVQQFAATVQGK